MKLRSALIPAAALGLAVALAFTPLTGAQTAPAGGNVAFPSNLKIAICNPTKVIEELKEIKDGQERLKAESANVQQQSQQKTQKVKDMQAELQMLKPSAPDFSVKQRALMTAAIELDSWNKVSEAELKRSAALLYKNIFDKIQATTARVAQQRGLDLVIADQRMIIPENQEPTLDLVRASIQNRTLLYANPAIDITADITATMDADYLKR